MMKSNLFRAAPALALTAGIAMAGQAVANPILENGVRDIGIDLQQTNFEIRVHNASNSPLLANQNLQVKTSSFTVPVDASYKCEKKWNALNSAARIGFGVFNPTFGDANVLHKEGIDPAAYEWVGGDWLAESSPTHNYQVPVASIKNPAKPDLQVDPLAEVQKMLDAYNGTEVGFYKGGHEVTLQRKVSMTVTCWKGNESAKATIWKPVNVKVVYEADPDLQTFALNPQLGQMNLPGDFQQGYNPMTVTTASLQPHIKNYVGNCPANLKFRINIKGAGEGRLRYRIVENSGTVWQSEIIDYSFADNGGNFMADDSYAVAWEGKDSLNKHARKFKLYVTYLDKDENGGLPNFNYYDMADWSHTCTPKLNAGIIQGGGIKANDAQQGGNAAPSAKFVPSALPDAAPSRQVKQAQPERQAVKPARAETKTETPSRLAPAPVAPSPVPALTIKQADEDERPARSSTR